MERLDLQSDNLKKVDKISELERGESLDADIEEIDLPFLTQESLSKIFNLHDLKLKFTEQLSDKEVFPFMDRIHAFEEKLRIKALNGELVYGDNIISEKDLNKFALYNILIGKNITPEVTWLDLEGDPIEKFIRNGFSEEGLE